MIAWFGALMSQDTGGTQRAFASVLYSVPVVSATIPAGGTAQFQVRGIALQPGSAIASYSLTPASQPFPPDKVRLALYYGINWGYTESDPQQAVLAVWYTEENAWRSDSHKDAENIVSAAINAPGVPSWNPSGRSALQLSASGQVAMSQITFTPSTQSAAVGSGTLTIANTSGGDLTVHLPYGSIFGDGGNATLVWAVGAVASTIPSATAITAINAPPTATATATGEPAVQQPTAQGPRKSVPTATGGTAIETPTQPPQKAPPGGLSKYTYTATATVVNTPISTSTSTDSPTSAPTYTSLPTATAIDTGIPTATATSTSTTTRIPPSVVVAKSTPTAVRIEDPQKRPSEQASSSATKDNRSSSVATATKLATVESANSVQAPQKTGDSSADTADVTPDNVIKGKTQAKKPSAVAQTEQAAPVTVNKSQVETKPDKLVQAVPVVLLTTVPSEGKQDIAVRSAAPPPPVSTAAASPSTALPGDPPAVQTINPTVPARAISPTAGTAASPTWTPIYQATATPLLKSTASPTKLENGLGSTKGQLPAPVPSAQVRPGAPPAAVPTKEQLPTVQALPTRLIDVETLPVTPGPVIDSTPNKAPPQPGGGQQPPIQPVQPPAGNTGPSPDANPRTGAGPSSLPLWLSLASTLLVLGGWKLRRLSTLQAATTVSTER